MLWMWYENEVLKIMRRKDYTEAFYSELISEKMVYSAETILSVALAKIPPVSSAIDIGCGLEIWLKTVLKLNNQKVDILGIDGPWIKPDWLVIPKEKFLAIDFSLETPRIDRKYDIAISLEVAEHLPPEKAGVFISFLTSTSDFVLFSAAIPFQGGTNHLNERWQAYWADLFEQKGYVPIDLIRPTLWNDDKISIHYRQNTILYVRKERAKEIKAPSLHDRQILSLVHPELYTKHAHPGAKRAFRKFRQSIVLSILKRICQKRKQSEFNS